jgi:hypothetical protein
MITIQKGTSNVQSVLGLAADRQGQRDIRLTLTPSVISNSTYVIMVSDKLFKIFLRVFCISIIRCTETFWSHVYTGIPSTPHPTPPRSSSLVHVVAFCKLADRICFEKGTLIFQLRTMRDSRYLDPSYIILFSLFLTNFLSLNQRWQLKIGHFIIYLSRMQSLLTYFVSLCVAFCLKPLMLFICSADLLGLYAVLSFKNKDTVTTPLNKNFSE